MFFQETRRKRESLIVQSMISMYCNANHKSLGIICADCQQLIGYAEKRLLSCMFGETKPVCKQCPVHCYSPKMREQMRLVMRWAGPRMILRHPIFAIVHLFDSHSVFKPKSRMASKSTTIK
ncbi:MAG: nitrous oxide-stimulated promoter family protein [Bacteroidales bacterium]